MRNSHSLKTLAAEILWWLRWFAEVVNLLAPIAVWAFG